MVAKSLGNIFGQKGKRIENTLGGGERLQDWTDEVRWKTYLWPKTINCVYILITNTRCSVVALSAVIKFMVVEVFNVEGPPNNRVCKET